MREFAVYGPRIALLTDITYLPYGEKKTAYLSTIIDACTKEILGWKVSPTLHVDFVLETVHQVISEHGDELTEDTMLHSDQGSDYTSYAYRELLDKSCLHRSMSRRGCCLDNAVQEGWFGHTKDDCASRLAECTTLEDVREVFAFYIPYYNERRPQWALAKLPPALYFQFCRDGKYPLDVPDPPQAPSFVDDRSALRECTQKLKVAAAVDTAAPASRQDVPGCAQPGKVPVASMPQTTA